MLNFNPVTFDVVAGLKHWGIVMAAALVVIFVTALCMSVLALGLGGPWQVVVHVGQGIVDLLRTSPRRCLALAQLTFREAWRKKTLWVFAVFAVLFLFAGWFLTDPTADPDLQVKSYVSFVLRTISWLILPVAVLLACWGLPEDIRARSLHTVVTKPVRRHEIVLGRILGYSAIGGLVLVVMGTVGYWWIDRQLPQAMGSQLTARVPVYGEISFIDNSGSDRDDKGKKLMEGVNTGDENMFRSFIEGTTKARAVWVFSNVDLARLDQQGGLVLESSFQSFRTYKGNIEKQLLCQYSLFNPTTQVRVRLKPFEVNEFRRNVYDVAAMNNTLQDEKEGKTVELASLLDDGKLTVEVACLSSAQFLGMARPDLFIRLPDRSFFASYFKCLFNIGLMMFMVIVLGVMSGCFVKGPVATILAASVVVIGKVWHAFLVSLATGRIDYNPNIRMAGRGLLDSFIRIPTHMNPTVELGNSFVYRMVQVIDTIELNGLWAVQHLFPDFGSFDTTEYVANAYDVPWAEATLPSLMTTVGFCIPWILIGYFSLRLRELEAK
jgi:hypothetical protein